MRHGVSGNANSGCCPLVVSAMAAGQLADQPAYLGRACVPGRCGGRERPFRIAGTRAVTLAVPVCLRLVRA